MAHLSCKPVRKCHACLLNLGSYCWIYKYPRGQWRHSRLCPGIENEELHASYRAWQKMPDVKTRKELRREFFRTRRRAHVHREFSEDRK